MPRDEFGHLERADLLLATRDNFQRVVGVDQSPLFLVLLQLVLLDIVPLIFGQITARHRRALLERRISVGILVPSDRPVLELLQVWVLIKYPVRLALPKSHPHADKPEIHLSLLKEEPFIGLSRMYPNYGDWLLKVCRRVGFKPRIVKEADGAASALAFVAAGFGVAVVGEPLQKIPAKDVIFRDLAPEDSAWMAVGAACKPNALTAPVASKFIHVLAQICGNGNAGSHAPANSHLN